MAKTRIKRPVGADPMLRLYAGGISYPPWFGFGHFALEDLHKRVPRIQIQYQGAPMFVPLTAFTVAEAIRPFGVSIDVWRLPS